MLEVQLGKLLTEIVDKTTVNNQYEVLTSSQKGIFSQEEYFTKQVASQDNTGYKIIRKGEFTYRSMSDTGAFYINRLSTKEIGIVSPAYPVFKISSDNLTPEYLELYFQSSFFQHQISNKSTGSTRLALKYNKLCSLLIPLPSKERQLEIVSTISNIKNIIKKIDRENALLDELIKSRFIEMFGDDLKGETVRLGDLSDVITKGTTPTTLGFEFVDEGINFVKIECITETYQFLKDKMLHITKECDEKLKRSRLVENDILFSIAGAIGRTAIVTSDILPANTNQALAIIRLKDDSGLNVDFLNEMLHTELVLEQVSGKANGAAQVNLSLTDVGNFKVIVPPMDKQMSFSNFVKQIDKSKFNVQKHLETMKELLNKKMDEYFN